MCKYFDKSKGIFKKLLYAKSKDPPPLHNFRFKLWTSRGPSKDKFISILYFRISSYLSGVNKTPFVLNLNKKLGFISFNF